jgi:hypothetical protein
MISMDFLTKQRISRNQPTQTTPHFTPLHATTAAYIGPQALRPLGTAAPHQVFCSKLMLFAISDDGSLTLFERVPSIRSRRRKRSSTWQSNQCHKFWEITA